jgi:hypothetical protein
MQLAGGDVNDTDDIWGNNSRHGGLIGDYEWYTPENIVEAAQQVMDGIDLDNRRHQAQLHNAFSSPFFDAAITKRHQKNYSAHKLAPQRLG